MVLKSVGQLSDLAQFSSSRLREEAQARDGMAGSYIILAMSAGLADRGRLKIVSRRRPPAGIISNAALATMMRQTTAEYSGVSPRF